MVRAAAAPVLLLALAGCGGSPDAPDRPRPAPERRIATGELRSPDARSPLVRAEGAAWRCAAEGGIRLSISAEGYATLSITGRLLASVAPTVGLVNRACRRAAGEGARRPAPPHGRVGAGVVRCRAPGDVVLDFGGGDLRVRAARDGRFLAAAAIRPDRLGVAGYWGAGCAVL